MKVNKQVQNSQLTNYSNKADAKKTYGRMIDFSWLIMLIAVGYQVLVHTDMKNIFALSCVVVGWALVVKALFLTNSFARHPFSTFLILGYALTQIYFPVVFMSIEGKSLIHNLELPNEVFLHALFSLIILLIAHLLYRRKASSSNRSLTAAQQVLQRLKFFVAPNNFQIWFMGFLGLFSMFFIHFFTSTSYDEKETGNNIIRSFIPFAYAPFFIPFSLLFGKVQIVSKRLKFQLLFYGMLIFVVSIGANSRGAFMYSFTALGYSFILGYLLKRFQMPKINLKIIVGFGAALWLFTGPIQDIGVAMVMVRGAREDVSRVALISKTLEVYEDSRAIAEYKKLAKVTNPDWDENYLDNIFLARFCNLKFNDLSLIQARGMGAGNPKMFEFSVNRFYSSFPSPVLKLLNIDVKKEEIVSSSIGDYLYYITTGDPYAMGWFRTGHFCGTGMATFGWWYLLVLGISIIPVYYLVDAFVLVLGKGTASSFKFSLCGLLSITSTFSFLPTESVINAVVFTLREWPQTVLLYFVIFQFTLIISSLFIKRGYINYHGKYSLAQNG
ncbi:hypothetical protein SAMN05444008_111169 [Cnuella takakiae]|uniref:O-antigen polysaccharide polymerase Wzy n=1 Tax=Cnuella takakiae TaxID=1302690 RepID=A0A1M5E208_9BACT|nr:hypothetical protein [Cnuella takakiae]OLY93801.1 hypothetical protein BUE76_19380 [Cnuella takakiae]SHF73101.1 hypothetical protein SAMN05444008_111169 [Cnuella takakiae]